MLDFISNNLASIIIGSFVFIIVGVVFIKLIRDKKNHKSSCGDCIFRLFLRKLCFFL